jgi:hypothetical protein
MPEKREPREWWLVPLKNTRLTALAFVNHDFATDVAKGMEVATIPVREVMPEEVGDGKTVHAEESAERTLIREFMEVMQTATDDLNGLVKRHHRAFPLWATKAAASAEGMSEMASTLREVLEVTDGQ